MQLHEVKRKTALKKTKRVGRGGDRGKTSGRGHKGQKAHGGHGIRPDMRDTIKKYPKIRGRGKNLNTGVKKVVKAVNIEKLDNFFESGDNITPAILVEKEIVRKVGGKVPAVKILSVGETKKKFTIERCKVSKLAQEKIEKAGGSVA